MNKTNFIESVLRDQEEKIKQLESQNESLKHRCAELERENERLDKMVMELGEYTPNGYIKLKAQADKLAEALELIKDTAKCTDDRFASMSDYIYHLCESSLNEYKTKKNIAMPIENPIFNLEVLSNIENRILQNTEDLRDLQMLNQFISAKNKDYIDTMMKANNITSFQNYLDERKKPYDQRNPKLGIFSGNLLAAISFLKDTLK